MLEIMRNRRSIRKFLDKPVEEEKLDVILESALRSPSSRGRNPWKIWVLMKPEDLLKASMAKPHGVDFVKDAKVAYIIAGYPETTDVWVEDCSIVSMVIQLQAEALGLGSCWGQIRNRMHDDVSASEYLKNTFGLDADSEVLSIIAVGYKGEEKKGHENIPYDKAVEL